MQSCTTRLHPLHQHQETYDKLSLGLFLGVYGRKDSWMNKIVKQLVDTLKLHCLISSISIWINREIFWRSRGTPHVHWFKKQPVYNRGYNFYLHQFLHWLPTMTWNWRRTRDATVPVCFCNTCIINMSHIKICFFFSSCTPLILSTIALLLNLKMA
jgi:hypothetical protein